MTCEKCNDTGWICERCGAEYESCAHGSAAGQACDCNPNGYYEFAEIIAEVEFSKLSSHIMKKSLYKVTFTVEKIVEAETMGIAESLARSDISEMDIYDTNNFMSYELTDDDMKKPHNSCMPIVR